MKEFMKERGKEKKLFGKKVVASKLLVVSFAKPKDRENVDPNTDYTVELEMEMKKKRKSDEFIYLDKSSPNSFRR